MAEFEKRRSSDSTIDMVAINLSEMRTDIRDMRKDVIDGMNKIADAMNALAKIEERQSATNNMIAKFEADLKSQEDRLDAIEKSQPEIQRIVSWVYSAIGFIATGLGAVIAKYLGLF